MDQAHPTRTIRLLIAYDGTDYNGWQRQRHDRTIQGEIEDRLAIMTNSRTDLHGAGRTDAGVHALGMVAHFATSSAISLDGLQRGLNSMLPPAIRILEATEVADSFHARFSARGKRYEYRLYTGSVMMPQERLYALHEPRPLDFPAIANCLASLTGTHDFSTFENSGSRDKGFASRKGAVRTLTVARLAFPDDDHLRPVFTFVGEGFLRHMVRNLVGTLLEVGRGQMSEEQFRQALTSRDRSAGGPTAPAHGLTLMEVYY